MTTLTIAILELLLAVFLHLYIVLQCLKFKDKELHKDNVWWARWYIILALSTAWSLTFYPGKSGRYYITQQMFVSFTMSTEAFSFVSQLMHMHKAREVDGLNTQYLTALTISRFTRIGFWVSMSKKKYSQFWFLILMDVLHTVMALCFFFFYKHISKSASKSSVLAFSTQDAPSRSKSN